MSDHERTSTISADAPTGGAEVVEFPRTRERRRFRPRLWRRRRRPKRFKIRKLRVLLILFFLGVLAIISALFGMFMAVASDLPHLQRPTHIPTTIVDRHGKAIGTLTGSERRIYLDETDIAPVMKHAIVSIEDRRFYTNSGVDLRGIARAAVEDVTSGQTVQGASTIPQQFVKISLAAENDRTVFQKLREAALAYHLTRRWSKEEILRNYLNQIYFGNGAYGIESAARTYFSYNHDRCGGRKPTDPKCASVLLPHEAALLAAMVASPSAFDPIQHPVAAKRRRDLVLLRMLEQGYLTRGLYESEKAEPLPTRDDLNFPEEDTEFPYFTSWIKPQVVDQLGGGQQGAQRAFEGGLQVKTTIDSRLQNAADRAIEDWLPKGQPGPRASLVAIANDTGEVRAMVGGDNYGTTPFNLATQGQRQPGSSFKPFVLAEALRQNISPQSTWESKKKTYILKGGEKFTVNNYEDAYNGAMTLANATTYSDNAVYAQVGMKVKTTKVAKLARRLGIRTPVSSNAAMALGGLREGVTPLDMAHAYETFATGGKLITGSLSPGQSDKSLPVPGPVGIERIDKLDGKKQRAVVLDDGQRMVNKVERHRVLTPEVAGTVSSILQTVVKNGTATRAQIPNVMIAGKTGTTEDYGDAWFVAWTKEYTVAVWVGYPDEFKPMKTEFQGEPVSGGTYPASIWKTFMQALLKIDPLPKKDGGDGTGKPIETPTPGAGTYVPPAATVAPPAATAAPPTTTDPGTGGTAPPAEEPPATDPPATDPPATDPPATDPPATDPGATGTGGAGDTAPPAGDGTG
jgi:penicillin-binding protein 1A